VSPLASSVLHKTVRTSTLPTSPPPTVVIQLLEHASTSTKFALDLAVIQCHVTSTTVSAKKPLTLFARLALVRTTPVPELLATCRLNLLGVEPLWPPTVRQPLPTLATSLLAATLSTDVLTPQ